MPVPFSFGSHECEDVLQEPTYDLPQDKPRRRSSLLKNIGNRIRKHHERRLPSQSNESSLQQQSIESPQLPPVRTVGQDRPSEATLPPRRAIPSLPRPQTFSRQKSECRDRLLEVPPSPTERRAAADHEHRRGLSANPVPNPPRRPPSPPSDPVPHPATSAPELRAHRCRDLDQPNGTPPADVSSNLSRRLSDLPPLLIPDPTDDFDLISTDHEEPEVDLPALHDECNRRWILNLSMHFRDESEREKFFVTFAETPTKWRRLTISLDYRHAPPDSLEDNVSKLHYQRDKSFCIYEAIRESLPEIQFYDTVTNLKLETTPADNQLHVHVREDANEIVNYPAISLFQHIDAPRIPESELEFVAHLSGFVYKVRVDGVIAIKKEIPGPDSIDEFLYEVNALHALLESEYVVQLTGLVTDDSGSVVRGLLLAYAPQGALVDLIYDTPLDELPWHRRERWAMQIVRGLADIHEAGFVQGDFTLSNIVVDDADDVKIVDINRRGCPVGWDPPELSTIIASGQSISMCIGNKTDLFQLGMVLWALAQNVDDPDRVDRPLPDVNDGVPEYFRQMVKACLSEKPQGRPSATTLLQRFPIYAGLPPSPTRPAVDFNPMVRHLGHSPSKDRSSKEYIDPKLAVTLDDVNNRHDRLVINDNASHFTSGQVTYVDPDYNPDYSNPNSTIYRFGSSGGSWVGVGQSRGRSPVSSRPRRRSSPYPQSHSSTTSLSHLGPSPSHPPCGSDCSDKEDDKFEDGDIDPGVDLYVRVRSYKDTNAKLLDSADRHDSGGDQPIPEFEKRNNRDTFKHRVRRAHNHGIPDTPLVDDLVSPLLHTDSGFDEQMPEDELEVENRG